MFSSTFNNQSLFTKSRRVLLLHTELLGGGGGGGGGAELGVEGGGEE